MLNFVRDGHKLDFGVVWTIISCLSKKKAMGHAAVY
jgi:hypothetical protein